MPVFIVSNEKWAAEFTERKIPVVGDDVKSQLGSTILHRTIMKLFADRGIKVRHTYQLNTGGNTDFLNMLDRSRLGSKRKSKTEAVQSVMPERMPDGDVHIGPSDYVAVAARQQGLLPADRGRGLRGNSDRAGAQDVGAGFARIRAAW